MVTIHDLRLKRLIRRKDGTLQPNVRAAAIGAASFGIGLIPATCIYALMRSNVIETAPSPDQTININMPDTTMPLDYKQDQENDVSYTPAVVVGGICTAGAFMIIKRQIKQSK